MIWASTTTIAVLVHPFTGPRKDISQRAALLEAQDLKRFFTLLEGKILGGRKFEFALERDFRPSGSVVVRCVVSDISGRKRGGLTPFFFSDRAFRTTFVSLQPFGR